MNAQKRLAHWLATKKRSYSEAVDLFIDLNIDTSKVPYFSVKKPDKIRVNILTHQLQRYARVHSIKPKLMTTPPATGSKAAGGKKNGKAGKGGSNSVGTGSGKVKIDTNPVVRFEKLPVQYQEKFKQASDLANQNKALHAELKFIKDDTEKAERRKELAGLITDNVKAGKRLWKEIDAWWAENSKLTPEESAAKEALDKQNRIRANKNYISRYHNSVKEKQQKEVAKRKAELDKWGVDYENLIGEDKASGNTGK